MIISVFGGAAPKDGEPAYEEARQLGFQLGSAGHTLLTGGYVGVMEAVSRGGREAGAHVIGATCSQIEKSHLDRKPNPYLLEEWRFETLQERLFALIERCDAAIAMPGGAGTLAEISIMWNEMIIGAIPHRPLILLGTPWQHTFSHFIEQFDSYISPRDRNFLVYSPDVPSVIETMKMLSAK
jgi:uncharacterized protein (TIGR00730 family)